jgi:membrane protease YdiL (CAAX protease family)
MLKNKLKKIEEKLINKSYLYIVLFAFSAKIIFILLPFEIIDYFFEIETGQDALINDLSGLILLIVTVILAPLIETFIFQYIVIKISFFFLKSALFSILLSAFLFGLNHLYSIPYFIVTFFAGIIYASLYFIAKAKNTNPFWMIFLVHALYNLTVSLLNEISK